jgi:3-oxoacyl-[acyl-carrier protein] reductase
MMSSTGERARSAVVTGAGGVLGTAIVKALLRDGAVVALVDIEPERIETLQHELPDAARTLALPCDITDDGQVEAAMASVIRDWGGVDILVNNAGVEPHGGVEMVDPADWDRAFAVNVRAPMMLVRQLTAHWRTKGTGSIVSIGSRAWMSGSSSAAYGATKAALIGLTRAIALELGPVGVTANVVAPSYFISPFSASWGDDASNKAFAADFAQASPLRRLVSPEDIAEAVAFLASPAARNITGEVLNVAAGSHFPPAVRQMS